MRLESVFELLLEASGVQESSFIWETCSGSSEDSQLLPQFKSQSAASRVLLKAVSCPDVPSFQEALLVCSNPKINPVIVGNKETSLQQERSFARTTARFEDISFETSQRSVCVGCGAKWNKNPKLIFKMCPCMLVAYCNDECQRAHWNEHKSACRAARKAKGGQTRHQNGHTWSW